MSKVDFTSGAKPTVDFTKPIQVGFGIEICDGAAHVDWQDVTYIGPYQSRFVIADAEGEYHTVGAATLRNKPVKLTTKQRYAACVYNCLNEGSLWANQERILDMLYYHLVCADLIKEES